MTVGDERREARRARHARIDHQAAVLRAYVTLWAVVTPIRGTCTATSLGVYGAIVAADDTLEPLALDLAWSVRDPCGVHWYGVGHWGEREYSPTLVRLVH